MISVTLSQHSTRTKRDFMLDLLERPFPEKVTWNRPEGGFFIFVHLPENWDAGEPFQKAVKKNVAFVTGRPFFVDGSGPAHLSAFRLPGLSGGHRGYREDHRHTYKGTGVKDTGPEGQALT